MTIVLLIFAAGFFLSIATLINQISLSNSGASVIATVTDSRIDETADRSGQHTYYEVQYEFSVNATGYSYSDETGRRNLWASIPRSDWDTARATGQIEVLYQPDNPWNNRPAAKEIDIGVSVMLIVLFGGFAALILFLLVRAKRAHINNPVL